jgi:hypothetical protein
MIRTKYAVALAAAMALGLLSAKVAVCADGRADRSANGNDAWDEVAPLAGGMRWQVAQAGPGGAATGGRGGEARSDDPFAPNELERGGGRGMGMPGMMGPGMGRASMEPMGRGGMPGQPGMLGAMGMDPARARIFEARNNLANMKDQDPEMYKLKMADLVLEEQTIDLTAKYRGISDNVDARAKVKQEIEGVVNKHFDVRGQLLLLKLKRLESQLQILHENIDRRTKARKEIVDKRVSDLIGREEDVGF